MYQSISIYVSVYLNLSICESNYLSVRSFKNDPFLVSFVIFTYYWKTVGFGGIRTRIVRVEGQHADHLTNPSSFSHFLCLSVSNSI